MKILPERPSGLKPDNFDCIVRNFQLWAVSSVFERKKYIPLPKGREFLGYLFAQVGATLLVQAYNDACRQPERWFPEPFASFVEDIIQLSPKYKDAEIMMALALFVPRLVEATDLAVAICFKDEQQIEQSKRKLNQLAKER